MTKSILCLLIELCWELNMLYTDIQWLIQRSLRSCKSQQWETMFPWKSTCGCQHLLLKTGSIVMMLSQRPDSEMWSHEHSWHYCSQRLETLTLSKGEMHGVVCAYYETITGELEHQNKGEHHYRSLPSILLSQGSISPFKIGHLGLHCAFKITKTLKPCIVSDKHSLLSW